MVEIIGIGPEKGNEHNDSAEKELGKELEEILDLESGAKSEANTEENTVEKESKAIELAKVREDLNETAETSFIRTGDLEDEPQKTEREPVAAEKPVEEEKNEGIWNKKMTRPAFVATLIGAALGYLGLKKTDINFHDGELIDSKAESLNTKIKEKRDELKNHIISKNLDDDKKESIIDDFDIFAKEKKKELYINPSIDAEKELVDYVEKIKSGIA